MASYNLNFAYLDDLTESNKTLTVKNASSDVTVTQCTEFFNMFAEVHSNDVNLKQINLQKIERTKLI